MNYLFLYTEVATYFLNSLKVLKLTTDAKILIVRWPINVEAPFDLDSYSDIRMLDRKGFSEEQLEAKIFEFNPDLIYVSGWSDKFYLRIARKYNGKIPTVVGIDNPWLGTLKQRIFSGVGRLYLKRHFSDVWIPGKPQEGYAKRLGYGCRNIHQGFYVADIGYYNSLYMSCLPGKELKYPHRFIFCARYVKWKGIHDLCTAFLGMKESERRDWELWCVGAGEEFPNRIEGKGIRHFGFVQPGEMEQFVADTGVYILPSHFEPWGVSVQEFAAAGFPLLLSNRIGAGTAFLGEGKNGLSFDPGSAGNIREAMVKIVQKSDKELLEMGKVSNSIAFSITPEKWVATLLDIVRREN